MADLHVCYVRINFDTNYYLHRELHAVCMLFDQIEIALSITCSLRVFYHLTMYMKCDKSFSQFKQKEGRNLRGLESVFQSLRNAASFVFLG